jgi:hypothetical protein
MVRWVGSASRGTFFINGKWFSKYCFECTQFILFNSLMGFFLFVCLQGPNQEGCSCESTPFGCCPDDVTAAKGKDFKGCGCVASEFGCCPDNFTPAQGSLIFMKNVIIDANVGRGNETAPAPRQIFKKLVIKSIKRPKIEDF